MKMRLVQSRLVTDDVAGLAAFYTELIGESVPLNDYYVEVPTGAMSVGFSKRRFTEWSAYAARTAGIAPPRSTEVDGPTVPRPVGKRCQVVLDFLVDDADAHFERIDRLGVEWVLLPTTQPWGSRSMIFRDPAGNLVNVFSRSAEPESG